jgi:hypothetical protein
MFLSTYGEHFSMHSKEEQTKLFYTANWMTTFFNWVPAKKNKGLILQVIPRFVEGSNVKYVTGSGQTTATKDRVFLYESEGNVKPFQRGRDRKEPGSSLMLEQPASKLASSQSQLSKFKKQRRHRQGGKTASSTDLDGMTSDENCSETASPPSSFTSLIPNTNEADYDLPPNKKKKVFPLSAPSAALLRNKIIAPTPHAESASTARSLATLLIWAAHNS